MVLLLSLYVRLSPRLSLLTHSCSSKVGLQLPPVLQPDFARVQLSVRKLQCVQLEVQRRGPPLVCAGAAITTDYSYSKLFFQLLLGPRPRPRPRSRGAL